MLPAPESLHLISNPCVIYYLYDIIFIPALLEFDEKVSFSNPEARAALE
jgi:hypothetical protein